MTRMLASASLPDAEYRSDGQLLEGFAQRREEAAFETLVERHGPMVLGVCRRVLHQTHDAEDAFQATFLALARKADSIKTESVGGWLYRVAYRLAIRLKARAARLTAEELPTVPLPGSEPLVQAAWRELCAVLDEELGRLPAKFRAPLVLCYLRGNTHEEAAEELGWPLGTVRSRLARARELLRVHLKRRGLVLSVSALATLLAADLACAAVSPALLASTCRHAVSGASTVPAHIAALAGQAGTSASSWSLVAGTITLAGLLAVALAMWSALPQPGPVPDPVSEPLPAVPAPAAPTDSPYPTAPANDAPAGPLVKANLVQTWNELAVNTVTLSKDGRILGASLPEKGIALYDTTTGKAIESEVFRNEHVGTFRLTFHEQLPAVVAACEETVRLEVVDKSKPQVKFAIQRAAVKALAVTLDGSTVASGGADQNLYTWQAATGMGLNQTNAHRAEVFWVTFAPDGKKLASVGGDNTVRVWDVATGQQACQFSGGNNTLRAAAFTPEGKAVVLASRAEACFFYDVAAGKELAQYVSTTIDLNALAFSPDAQTLATGSRDHQVLLLEVATGKELYRLPGHKGRITTLSFSGDGSKLASGGDDATVNLWHLAVGR
jgi:RNA polymerase sigma factor (sigma-70 family)